VGGQESGVVSAQALPSVPRREQAKQGL
jgi:hypothetical protein